MKQNIFYLFGFFLFLTIFIIPVTSNENYTNVATDVERLSSSYDTETLYNLLDYENVFIIGKGGYVDEWVQYSFNNPYPITQYSISCKDTNKKLIEWRLVGSNDMVNWDTLHHVEQANWVITEEYQEKKYIINPHKNEYQFYRLELIRSQHNNELQFLHWGLYMVDVEKEENFFEDLDLDLAGIIFLIFITCFLVFLGFMFDFTFTSFGMFIIGLLLFFSNIHYIFAVIYMIAGILFLKN